MNRLVVFESVHQAIRAEKLMKKSGIHFDMVPTPREISASCGQSLAFDDADSIVVKDIMEQDKVLYRGIFSTDTRRRIYELVHQGRTS